MINSNHHQAVDALGRNLKAVQFSEDNVIEAFVHKSLPVMGVQWHPERLPSVQTTAAIQQVAEEVRVLGLTSAGAYLEKL